MHQDPMFYNFFDRVNSSPSSGASSPFGPAQEKCPLVSPQTSRSVSDLNNRTGNFPTVTNSNHEAPTGISLLGVLLGVNLFIIFHPLVYSFCPFLNFWHFFLEILNLYCLDLEEWCDSFSGETLGVFLILVDHFMEIWINMPF